MLQNHLIDRVAQELNISSRQARAALALFDEGATIPFVARYRKEVTGGLDDLQLRNLAERAQYLHEMEERRAAILASILSGVVGLDKIGEILGNTGPLDDACRALVDAANLAGGPDNITAAILQVDAA
jgi:transcriptional accessory protein Tex/SPT6